MKDRTRQIIISPDTTIIQTLEIIDKTALEIALVTDKNNVLLGTVTDGDIRRALIAGANLKDKIESVMNKNPKTAYLSTTDDELLFIMTHNSIKQLPVVDNRKRILRLVLLQELIRRKPKKTVAVIMAGGKGKRLGKLTRDLPKPLLPVGGRPLIAIIVEQLKRHGIENIVITVNYHSDKIKNYFAHNPVDKTNISYIDETKYLGTAGSLSLLKNIPQEPFIVMNADILSLVNFENMLQYHITAGKPFTLCTREFSFEIPYGVIKMRGDELIKIEEKPSQSMFINAGIYVLDPTVLKHIPKNEPFDMPELINSLKLANKGISCYPLSEYWIDIGNPADYERAAKTFYQE